MVEFGQFVIGGLSFGAIYGLAALGLVLIFKTTGVVNFASGAMATVAMLMGIPVFRLVTASWAIGVLVAGLAAILVAPTVSLSPTMMDDIAVYAFAAAVLGGFGSLAGAIVGGFVIGVVNSLIGAYLST